MIEFLTDADVGTISGYMAGSFAIGWVGGRIQLAYIKLTESL